MSGLFSYKELFTQPLPVKPLCESIWKSSSWIRRCVEHGFVLTSSFLEREEFVKHGEFSTILQYTHSLAGEMSVTQLWLLTSQNLLQLYDQKT